MTTNARKDPLNPDRLGNAKPILTPKYQRTRAYRIQVMRRQTRNPTRGRWVLWPSSAGLLLEEA